MYQCKAVIMDMHIAELQRAIESGQWSESRSVLDANKDLKYGLTSDFIIGKMLHNRPPLDVLLMCLSPKNISLEIIRYTLDSICCCLEDRQHFLYEALEHFRPKELTLKPVTLYNADSEHYFCLYLLSDISQSNLKQLSLSVPSMAADTYFCLFQAGFPTMEVQKRIVTCQLNLDIQLSKEMLDICMQNARMPASLQSLCRNGIRDHIQTLKPSDFLQLPMP